VHVQKDKRAALHPHYDKCVFIGYPPGYKGWKFYNPTTKRTIIFERADFDECPVNTSSTKHPAVVNHQQLNPPNAPYAPPELTGDVDDDEPVAAPEMPPGWVTNHIVQILLNFLDSLQRHSILKNLGLMLSTKKPCMIFYTNP